MRSAFRFLPMYFKHIFTQLILSGSTEDYILQIMRLTVIKFSFYIVFKAFMRESYALTMTLIYFCIAVLAYFVRKNIY